MLISIYGKMGQNFKDLVLPTIYLDTKFNYKIGLTHLTFELEDKLNIRDGELMILKTNMVDLSMCNPDQALVHVNYYTRRIIQHFRPPIVLYQWMSNLNINGASFELRSQATNKALICTNIFLQLEIKRIDDYGRF
jgi:hypothetical protein